MGKNEKIDTLLKIAKDIGAENIYINGRRKGSLDNEDFDDIDTLRNKINNGDIELDAIEVNHIFGNHKSASISIMDEDKIKEYSEFTNGTDPMSCAYADGGRPCFSCKEYDNCLLQKYNAENRGK